jgi:hypothetical protein
MQTMTIFREDHMSAVTHLLTSVLFVLTVRVVAPAQTIEKEDSTGLPGDNFSMQGALEAFKKAGSPEEFEKLINSEESRINNLDLNADGNIDYVRVVGRTEEDVHIFVLQVPVSEKESQDIAVIELEKSGDESATIQIVGDEDIYGEQTIVEPGEGNDRDQEAEDDAGGGRPHFAGLDSHSPPVVVVNVWTWPCVRYVYGPTYTVWVSPWRWRVYPGWWRPWKPIAWRVFHPFRFHRGYAVVHTHRVVRAHRVYAPTRVTSVTVRTRHHGAVTRHRVTKTTTIKGKDGAVKVKKSRTTTRVKKGRK